MEYVWLRFSAGCISCIPCCLWFWKPGYARLVWEIGLHQLQSGTMVSNYGSTNRLRICLQISWHHLQWKLWRLRTPYFLDSGGWIRWTNPNKSNVTSETSSSTCLASLLSFCAGVTSAEDKEMSSGNNRKHPNTRVETVFRLSSVRGSLAFFSVTQGRRYTLPRKQICTTRVCPVSPYCSEGQGDKNKKQYLYSMDWFQRTSRESVVFSPNIHYLQDASTLTVVSRERNIGPGGMECTT